MFYTETMKLDSFYFVLCKCRSPSFIRKISETQDVLPVTAKTRCVIYHSFLKNG